ncbi:hypothetical protein [Miltoncostaea marina]|uniref:hypothetical protein n=1 Tax=Miltoncostaea marina TaxID=2843215 RepID=UPI001C3E1246|nr:hypothetical protein [Miltoncostaea marina]
MRGRRTGRAIALGAVAGATLLGLAAAQSEAGRSLLSDAGLAAPQEGYTALAFARPAELPATPAAGAAIPVGFTVANREGAARAYAWRVVEDPPGGEPAVLARGRLPVADGATAAARTRVRPSCDGPRTRVSVALDDPARRIGFWVTCSAGAAP